MLRATTVALCLWVASSVVQAQRSRVRVERYEGKRLETVVRADDGLVVLQRDYDVAITKGPLTAWQELYRIVMSADIITIADVVAVEERRVDDDSWLMTSAHSAIRQLVYRYREDPPLAVGDTFDVSIVGGQIEFNGVTVRAGSNVPPIAGRRYLLFLTSTDEGYQPLHAPLAVVGARLTSTRAKGVPGVPADPLNGMLMSDVLAEVHRLIQRRQR